MADFSSSDQPRPRPRPKPVAKKAANAIPTSTPGASSSSGGLASSPPKGRVIVVEDTDEMFMRNRNRTSKTWKRLAEINKEVPKTERMDSDSDNEMSPRSKNKRKKNDLSAPLWQKDKVLARMLSEAVSDDSDSDLELIGISLTPNDKQNGKRKRQQRSRSITPPPALPLHQVQNAKNIVRQALAPVPRAASPTHIDWDESADAITLQPELKAIAKEIAENSQHIHLMNDKEAPISGTDYVTLTVKWQPHPLDQHGKAEKWQYKIDRSDNFRELFEATADDANIMAENLIMTYRDKRFFPSVTPHTLKIWTETAELVACTKATYEYTRAHSHSIKNTSFGSSNAGKEVIDIDSNDEGGALGGALFPPESQQSDAESESDQGKFKLILRSALTANKEISLVVRPATKCGAIVKAFLKKAGLAGQYPEVFADALASMTKKGGRKSKGSDAGKDPRLCLDGDKLDNTSEIGDADLEDGDLIEVVGL